MGAKKREALEQFNRDNILTAAKELFDEKGVEKTTMDDIALHADYSKSTIYVYFKSKEDIYNSIIRDYMEILVGELTACIDGTDDFEDSYFRLCNCIAGFEERYPEYYAGLVASQNRTGSRKRALYSRDMIGNELNSLIAKLLEKGQRCKILRDDLEIWPTVLYIWSAISGIIQVADQKKDMIERHFRMNKEEYLRYAFRMFYESLVKR
ncbi:MAG: TetR/AcrR family transcriptional regulator [Lachnospiraceae bacterium]|nr:TetR/AcrR family transcriptional regulator [Lachnospiraceae bacterium]